MGFRTTPNALEQSTADVLQNFTERSGGKGSGRAPEPTKRSGGKDSGRAPEPHWTLWRKGQRTDSRTTLNALEERKADGLQNYTERSGGKDSGRAPEIHWTLWRKGKRTGFRTTLNALEERTADGLQNYTERSGRKNRGRTPELQWSLRRKDPPNASVRLELLFVSTPARSPHISNWVIPAP